MTTAKVTGSAGPAGPAGGGVAGDPGAASGRRAIRRALLSVSDKTGLAELAAGLAGCGIQLVSTGSSARRIAEAGVEVTTVEQVTGFAEAFDGRVKTLHPAVHAGLLADRRRPEHLEQLRELGIAPFDLVVCNLYPFASTVAKGAGSEECIEQIDIGGPAMVRSAAKNHASVAVVVDPARYDWVLRQVRAGGLDLAARRELAAAAFAHTAAYDTAVATWFATEVAAEQSAESTSDDSAPGAGGQLWPAFQGRAMHRRAVLRYGENPHQQAALYVDPAVPRGIAQAEQLHGKEMSYNNFVDADAAWRAAHDHAEPCVAVIKHANPCGIAITPEAPGGPDDPIADAHRRAHACDPVSAFGGVIAANREVTVRMAEQVAEVFTEVVVAPSFAPDAVRVLTRRKNVRLLVARPPARTRDDGGRLLEQRAVSGGVLVQTMDLVDTPGDDPAAWRLACGQPATPEQLADLVFAWRTCRAVRSNAILLARDAATVGVGMGQVNRVDAARLAVARAGERAGGAVAASDAYFPFPDGLEVLMEAGVRAVVQPGGSVRDAEVVAAAQAGGVTLYLTGTRHFAH